jgi:acetoin utilization protein AcuB
MTIEPWMKHPVVTVKPGDSARHAREIMEKHRINQLPVVLNGALVGIVTDRDLRDAFPSVFATAQDAVRRRRPAAQSDPDKIPVEDVMARTVLTLAPQASMADAARLMRRERIGAVPVVERGRLVGIVTRSDLLDAFATGEDRAVAG